MSIRGRVALVLTQLLALGACGGKATDPTPVQPSDFPLVSREGCQTPGGGVTDTGLYMIVGLGNNVIDPNASPLRATMRVGESVILELTAWGCSIDSPWKTSFISTNPAIAIVVPELPDGYPKTNQDFVQLKALAPGDTAIFADFWVEAQPGKGATYRTNDRVLPHA